MTNYPKKYTPFSDIHRKKTGITYLREMRRVDRLEAGCCLVLVNNIT